MAGTPGACSQVFFHPIRCMLYAFISTETFSPYHRQNHHHHQAQTGLCDRFCCASPRMDESSGQPMSAAQRRRQRRLRSMLRHEQQSIRMARTRCTLSTALHGARPQPPGPERERSTSSTKAYGHRTDLSRGRGRNLSRRCPSRRVRQPRSVTWLPGLLSSGVRNCWPTRLPRPSMVGPSGTSSRRTLPGRRRRRRRRRRGGGHSMRRRSCSSVARSLVLPLRPAL